MSWTVSILKDHFLDRWREFVGAIPTIESVNRIIRDGIQITPQCRVLVEQPDGSMRPRKQIAAFWNNKSGASSGWTSTLKPP